jgi:hypothetical protein
MSLKTTLQQNKESKKEKYVTQKEFQVFASHITHTVGTMVTKDQFETTLNKQHHEVMTVLDGIVGRLDNQNVENAAQESINHRHETWIKDLATHTDCTLTTEV